MVCSFYCCLAVRLCLLRIALGSESCVADTLYTGWCVGSVQEYLLSEKVNFITRGGIKSLFSNPVFVRRQSFFYQKGTFW